MNKEIDARIKNITKTTSEWASSTLVLLDGEIGIELLTDGTWKMKIGDGKNTWSALPYETATIKNGSISKDQLDTGVQASLGKADAAATKLTTIAEGAEVNVQSDWNITDTASDAFVKNKPDLSVYAKKSEYLPLAGGTMTGELKVGSSAKIQTNGYVIGTWLQATTANALNSKPPRICVQDVSGWIYSRTPDQILDDIGATKVQLVTWEAGD